MQVIASDSSRGATSHLVGLRMMDGPPFQCFGVVTEERLRRQLARLPVSQDSLELCAARHVVVDAAALACLFDNPDQFVLDEAGRPLIGVVSMRGQATPPEGGGVLSLDGGSRFVRALRRRVNPLVIDLRAVPLGAAEQQLFDNVYKGATDIVTKRLWPVPAFHVTRALAYLHVSPNAVTIVGLMLTLLAAILFARADWGWALAAAWLMTFLDTVDGKLARTSVTSSELGNKLDHLNDVIHPPIWWTCVAFGLVREPGGLADSLVWIGLAIIALFYCMGRVCESWFKRRFGFNQYMWTRFDSVLREIISRRNIILLVLTAGALFGRIDIAFLIAAGWSLISIGVQCLRVAQARRDFAAGRPIDNWMDHSLS
jgi:phosphatidylglycerophosphate synthase